MFYVGHFMWQGVQPEVLTDPQPGEWFTLLVEADSVESASEKFQDLIKDLKYWFIGFDPVANVFVDAIIEVKSLPAEGVLAYFEHGSDVVRTIATSLPNVSPEHCVSWHLSEEVGDDEDFAPDMEPFVSFEE